MLPPLPRLAATLSAVWTADIFQGTGRKQSLKEVRCIIMKIKDTLITAAKWYWTSVNAREGTSKIEDSWTSHKTKWLSAYMWGCEQGTWAASLCVPSLGSPQGTRWLRTCCLAPVSAAGPAAATGLPCSHLLPFNLPTSSFFLIHNKSCSLWSASFCISCCSIMGN